MAGSFAVHAVVVLIAIFGASVAPRPIPVKNYRVKLVALADQRAPERLDPAPPRVAPEEHRPPPVQPQPAPRQETEAPAIVEEVPTPAEPEREPARAPEEGEETVNVQLDGAAFVAPEYLENIIRQVNRYWRPPTGSRALRAEIAFTIHEDGSVNDISWVARSGDPTFDLQARGAIEAAGRSLVFGPLPEAYPRDRLRVSFYFDPSVR